MKEFIVQIDETKVPEEFLHQMEKQHEELIRCKDCKHRPEKAEESDEYDMDTDLEFPDEVCPCQCEDFWYSWMPDDGWFCPVGERKEE